MVKPDLYACPVPTCLTPPGDLTFVRIPDHASSGHRGCFYTCTCGALTKSMSGELNLRDDVAQAYGVTRRDGLKKVGPTIRRKK